MNDPTLSRCTRCGARKYEDALYDVHEYRSVCDSCADELEFQPCLAANEPLSCWCWTRGKARCAPERFDMRRVVTVEGRAA